MNIQAGDRTKFHFEASTVVRSGYGGQPRPGAETTVSHTKADRVESTRVKASTRDLRGADCTGGLHCDHESQWEDDRCMSRRNAAESNVDDVK